MELPKYQSNEVVQAGKITAFEDPYILWENPETGEDVELLLSPDWINFHKPAVGGYIVKCGVRYRYSDRVDFEANFSRLHVYNQEDANARAKYSLVTPEIDITDVLA